MTRRDYISTAIILHEFGPEGSDSIDRRVLTNLVEQFATMFIDDNPRFDVNKFYEACGLELIF